MNNKCPSRFRAPRHRLENQGIYKHIYIYIEVLCLIKPCVVGRPERWQGGLGDEGVCGRYTQLFGVESGISAPLSHLEVIRKAIRSRCRQRRRRQRRRRRPCLPSTTSLIGLYSSNTRHRYLIYLSDPLQFTW